MSELAVFWGTVAAFAASSANIAIWVQWRAWKKETDYWQGGYHEYHHRPSENTGRC